VYLRSEHRITSVALAKVLISGLVLATGFRAISDDDYARVVIAQSFAQTPRLDPSGTSWLPLPFWVQGGVMLLFGRGLEVARITASVTGVLSALAVLLAAKWCGATPRGAWMGALLGTALPYAAWLGVATVPDGPTAALLLIAMAATTGRELGRWALGGLFLLGATLSRYEAWPVAVGFALLGAVEAVRERRWRLVGPGALALLGPSLWMLGGALQHGSPLFFLARVAAYREALGVAPTSLLVRAFWYPLALIRCEPELAGLFLVSLAFAWYGRNLHELSKYRRPAWLGLGLLGFVMLGDVANGAATHHRERVLLSLWLCMAVCVGDLSDRSLAELGREGKRMLAMACLLSLGLGMASRRGWAGHDGFVDRREEILLGRYARDEAARGAGHLLVDTEDYGYFAVLAAFADPARARALDERDPRQKTRLPAPFSSLQALRARLEQEGCRWLIATQAHRNLAREVGTPRAETARLLLVDRIR
jgi:hypothetical protein